MKPASILLCDDEEFFRMTLREVVASRIPGVEFFEAGNGEEALRVLECNDVDCVVTDLAMPVMDGVDLMREMLHRGSRASLMVVSAYAQNSPSLHGTPRCVVKPVDLFRLCGHIEELLTDHVLAEASSITPIGLLQVLSWGRRGGMMKVSAGSSSESRWHGTMSLCQGQLTGARIVDGHPDGSTRTRFVGVDAALEMLLCERPWIEIVDGRDPSMSAETKVDLPLLHLFAQAKARRQARALDAASRG